MADTSPSKQAGKPTVGDFRDPLLQINFDDPEKKKDNVDMSQNMTGPQFVETLINSMSQNEEYPCVTAIDDGSVSEKLQRKLDALFRMREAATIDDLQQQAGIQLEPVDAYVPNDELSAEV